MLLGALLAPIPMLPRGGGGGDLDDLHANHDDHPDDDHDGGENYDDCVELAVAAEDARQVAHEARAVARAAAAAADALLETVSGAASNASSPLSPRRHQRHAVSTLASPLIASSAESQTEAMRAAQHARVQAQAAELVVAGLPADLAEVLDGRGASVTGAGAALDNGEDRVRSHFLSPILSTTPNAQRTPRGVGWGSVPRTNLGRPPSTSPGVTPPPSLDRLSSARSAYGNAAAARQDRQAAVAACSASGTETAVFRV